MIPRAATGLVFSVAVLLVALGGCGDDECSTCVDDNQPKLSLDPKSLDLGADQLTHQFNVVNKGKNSLEWSASTSAPWLQVVPSSGTTTTEVDPVVVTVDRTDLDLGSYSTHVVVTSNGGSDSVAVAMEVVPGLFEIAVKTPGGQPVPDLRVSLWNMLPCSVLGDGSPCTGKAAAPVNGVARATTEFAFEIDADGRVDLEVFDLDGRHVESIIDDEVLEAGPYTTLWYGPLDAVGTAIYTVVLSVYDLDRTQLFSPPDTVYSVVAKVDPEESVVGSTDAGGEFKTEDRTLFPGLDPDLPTLEQFDAACNPLGTFTLQPEVYVYLQSADGTMKDDYQLTLEGTSNRFDLVWDPTPVAAGAKRGPAGFAAGAWADRADPAPAGRAVLMRAFDPGRRVSAMSDTLFVNCPNPFN
jgi:hypothetical protein